VSGGTPEYREALDYLFARVTGKWKLGLERMNALLDEIGRPQDALEAFHVGGTNGKGSVCATLDALLRSEGRRVGVYTSPHLVDFRERFRIDGQPITEADVVEWISQRADLVERLGATFFEATTAMGFELFARERVDVAVIEVGLGGRLDATNVLRPLAAGVASIGIDHVEYLGHTREAIAWEKAGIFKAGRPAVIGEQDPSIRNILARFAHEAGAEPVVIVADDYAVSNVSVGGPPIGESAGDKLPPATEEMAETSGAAVRGADGGGGTWFTLARGAERRALYTPLAGAHQAANAALSIAMLDAAGPPYATSLATAAPELARVHLPGRFDWRGPFIFDVAHNPDGAAVLADTIRAVRPSQPVVALLAILGDKDWRGIMAQLAPVVSTFVLTMAPTAPVSRAWAPSEVLDYARAQGWSAEHVPDFDRALGRARSMGGTVLVTGSFHTVGDAMARLQVSPLGT
jgi:dihydrofolate synthase/folylpolyglutamate synthase